MGVTSKDIDVHALLYCDGMACACSDHCNVQGFTRLYFPEYLQQYTSIDLTNNSLSRLPADIKHLVTLSQLILNNNNLELLPEEIGQLESLEILFLKNNSIHHNNYFPRYIDIYFLQEECREPSVSLYARAGEYVGWQNVTY